LFRSQLLFSMMTDKGDSGSIIVHSPTNSALGLYFGQDERFSNANPLWAKGWKFEGTHTVGAHEGLAYRSHWNVPCVAQDIAPGSTERRGPEMPFDLLATAMRPSDRRRHRAGRALQGPAK
jgi:hypothetical protein